VNTDDEDELLAFFDFPAEHWIHLRTTNPIESTFATVRLRTKVTRGAGSWGAAPRHGLQADRIRASPLGSVVKCHVRIRGSNYELPSHAVRSAAIGIVIATWHHDRHE
jgi:hypothetical protein